MSQPSRCPVCAGSNLSPETTFKSQSNNKSLELEFQGPESSWADSGKRAYAVNRGRACLDCGHVIVFLRADALAALRAELPTLKPIDSSD